MSGQKQVALGRRMPTSDRVMRIASVEVSAPSPFTSPRAVSTPTGTSSRSRIRFTIMTSVAVRVPSPLISPHTKAGFCRIENASTLNLNGFYNVLHPIVLPMVRRRKAGRIVTISSASGLMGNRGQVNYSASKAGIIGASKALALDLAKKKITVNCVAPGLIESEMTDNLPLEKILETIPAGRIGKPEEVAAMVAFLCSPDAAYITRQVFSVNGGMC